MAQNKTALTKKKKVLRRLKSFNVLLNSCSSRYTVKAIPFNHLSLSCLSVEGMMCVLVTMVFL